MKMETIYINNQKLLTEGECQH